MFARPKRCVELERWLLFGVRLGKPQLLVVHRALRNIQR